MLTLQFPSVLVHFMSEWAHRHAGVAFTEDYFFDHHVGVQVRQAIERMMYRLFGEVGLGAEDPLPNPTLDCAGGILGKAIFGIPVTFHADRAPDTHALNLSPEEMTAFRLNPAFVDAFPFDRIRPQLAAIREEYGTVQPTYDLFHHGVVNLGLELRGNDLFLDIYERPEEVKAWFSHLGDGLLAVADYSESLMGPMPCYKVGHCSMGMFPPEFYLEFVLPIDAQLARRVQPFGIHHHGHTDNGHLDAYKELETRSGVSIELFDLDWNADFAHFRQLFPQAQLFYLMEPSKIAEGDERWYRSEVERVLNALGSAERVTFMAGDLDDRVSPAQVIAFVRAVRELTGKE